MNSIGQLHLDSVIQALYHTSVYYNLDLCSLFNLFYSKLAWIG